MLFDLMVRSSRRRRLEPRGDLPQNILRITDKMPTNFIELGLIRILFPKARIIHCIRNSMDTCLSNYFQNFEEGKNFESAIENYQIAAEYLKSSGYLMNKIDDIYSRIEELKEFAKQEKIYHQASAKSQVEQIQDQAFSLLDGAQKLESDGFLEDAINQYMSAIKLLVQAGWSESQLSDLKDKLTQMAGIIEQKE